MIKNRITQGVSCADELSHGREHAMIPSPILLRQCETSAWLT
jgi:hypothetical protein